jgi:O-succinylbenzoate synthase
MSKMALEMAVLDIELKTAKLSLADRLGGTRKRVEVGAVVGINTDEKGLLSEVAVLVEKGYRRVKMKIMPGFDVCPTRKVREEFPDLQLQVDANGSYTTSQIPELIALDTLSLSLLEQPFADDDLLSHAELRKVMSTPICLDESIRSVNDVHLAIALGACDSLCVKPGRVGGYLSAVAIHDVCVGAGMPVWCGGMYETAVARSANVSLASLPGFSLPSDLEAPSDYLEVDVAEMLEVRYGEIDVPTSYGLPVWPDEDILMQVATERRWIPVKKQ